MSAPITVDWGNMTEENKLLNILTGHIYKYTTRLEPDPTKPLNGICVIPTSMEWCTRDELMTAHLGYGGVYAYVYIDGMWHGINSEESHRRGYWKKYHK